MKETDQPQWVSQAINHSEFILWEKEEVWEHVQPQLALCATMILQFLSIFFTSFYFLVILSLIPLFHLIFFISYLLFLLVLTSLLLVSYRSLFLSPAFPQWQSVRFMKASPQFLLFLLLLFILFRSLIVPCLHVLYCLYKNNSLLQIQIIKHN